MKPIIPIFLCLAIIAVIGGEWLARSRTSKPVQGSDEMQPVTNLAVGENATAEGTNHCIAIGKDALNTNDYALVLRFEDGSQMEILLPRNKRIVLWKKRDNLRIGK